MNGFLKRTLQGDKVVWMIFIILVGISILSMFSASSYLVSRSGSIQGPILRHVMFIVAGFVVIILVQLIEFKWMKIIGYLGLVISIILLFVTLFSGVEQAGAARFLKLGGFQFQPSEIAKVSLIICIAHQIEYMQNEDYQRKYYYIVVAFIFITCGLIFLENLSTAAILFTTTMVMMFIADVKFKRLLLTCLFVVTLVGIIIGVAAMIPEETYRESDSKVLGLFERAYTWVARLDNFSESAGENKYVITDSNYQEAHAQIAVARGGFLPHLPGSSQQRNFLPEAYSDFIFAIIVEEGGFFAGVFVIMLYLILLYRAGTVARNSSSLFGAVLVIGVTLLIVLQAFIHVGVSVHLGPVTGQPLPLVSRGGTSTLVNCFYFGVIINVTRYMTREKEKNMTVETVENKSDNQMTKVDKE